MWEESFRITTKEEITLFRGKKYKDSAKLVDRSTQYEVPAAMDLVVKTASAKFDETVEVHIKLGVDSRHADQQVRGAIVLPNGTGKTRKVLVFAKDAKLDEAKEAGADFAGGMELVEKIQKENWFDFDVVVATPDMMSIVGRLGKVLGPKGLMPSPKAGTVTPNVTAAVKEIKAGKIEYRLDKTGQNGERYDRAIATRGNDYLMVYNYTGRPMEVDFSKISGAKKNAWWYTTKDGKLEYIGEFDNGVHKFQHDSGYCSGNDHILIVVDSSKNYIGKDWTELPDAQQKWNK